VVEVVVDAAVLAVARDAAVEPAAKAADRVEAVRVETVVSAAVLAVARDAAVEPAAKAADRVEAVRVEKVVSAAVEAVRARVVTAMADVATVEASSSRT
jgi:hypothetical protein